MSRPTPFTLTKIIGTIGPATDHPDQLERLVEQGLRVVRLNLSHGALDEHARHVQTVHEVAARTGSTLAILADLPGPKVRLVGVERSGIELVAGDRVVFPDEAESSRAGDGNDPVRLATTHEPLPREVEAGQRVLIDDGRVRLLAIGREEDEAGGRLVCRVTAGGPVGDKKGVNLPDTRVSLPAVTDYDWQCIDWAVEHNLDYLALSFVRSHEDIEQLKQGLGHLRSSATGGGAATPPVLAKIETPRAMDNLESIIDAADATMIARGDLGVEMDPWEVPLVQKRAIRLAHDAGKPVVVATQMLESMVERDWATRAEVSDIANAVMDGADALMLSGETAIGRHPEAAVRIMRHTAFSAARFAETETERRAGPPRKLQVCRYRTAALAHGVRVVVRDLEARYVVVWSERGGGARYLSQNRLAVPILGASTNPAALRRMCLMFGVEPVPMDRPTDVESFLRDINRLLLGQPWAEPGDPIVVVVGEPLGTAGVTNEMRIHYVGDPSCVSS